MTFPRTLSAALAGIAMSLALGTTANAQTALSAYTDDKGFLDVQALTCAQLADTFQEDADMLSAWYSGWYNGLAKKHFAHVTRVESGEHALIVYCKANRSQKIIEALDGLFKDEKAQKGIK